MRRINPTTVLLLPVALALMLGAAPRDAGAAALACKNLEGIKRKSGGCVTSQDVKDGALSHNVVKNMAGQRSFLIRRTKMKVPANGWVTINASAHIDASGAAGPVTVKCRLVPKGDGVVTPTPYRVEESLNPDKGVSFANVVATKVYRVEFRKEDLLRVNFSCSQNAAVTIKVIGLSAKFVPTRYQARR